MGTIPIVLEEDKKICTHQKLIKKSVFKKIKLFKNTYKKTFYFKIKVNKIRNKYSQELLKKQKKIYIKTFEKHKHNIKETWKTINNLLDNAKTPLFSSLSINGQTVQNFSKITNHFNEYFVGVVKQLVSNLQQKLSNIKTSLHPPTIQLVYLSQQVLLK